jgi:hypothetical protein
MRFENINRLGRSPTFVGAPSLRALFVFHTHSFTYRQRITAYNTLMDCGL